MSVSNTSKLYTMVTMNDSVMNAGNTLWEYMRLHQRAIPADCLLVIGSLNDSIAVEAARLENEHIYKTIVISGGNSRITKTRALGWGNDTEAEHFRKIMLESGSMRTDIILEKHASNTGENASFTYALLKERGLIPSSMVVLTKPYMERRAQATFDIQWPDRRTKISFASMPMTLLQYCRTETRVDYTLHIMVGDLQRIIEYPNHGYQSKQFVPEPVMEAFSILKTAGFTNHLLHDES